MSTNVPVHFEGVDDAVIHELCTGAHMKDVLASQQAKEQQEESEILSDKMKAHNGLGCATMNIDALQYHGWAKRFDTYDCWSDRDFQRYFLRKNPEAKVRGFGGTRIQSGWTSPLKRFVKRYDWQNEDRVV